MVRVLAASPGLFALDLAVLGDGRLGTCLEDGRAVAVGPRDLRAHLVQAGWSGADLLLLAQPPAEQWNAVVEHARQLIETLAVDVRLAAAGAEVWVRPDGSLDAEGPDGAERAWRVLQYGHPTDDGRDAQLPPALAGAPATAPLPVSPAPATAGAEPITVSPESITVSPKPITVSPELVPANLEPVAVSASVEPAPTVSVPARMPGAHAARWLPPSPVVNARPIDVYLASASADGAGGWVLPSADLFLLAGRDPLRLAEAGLIRSLLRVHASAQCAIDLDEHRHHAPDPVRRRLAETGCTHLLPMAWLAGVRATASYDVDGSGGISAGRGVHGGVLAVRFEGAEHGVPGLPNEVVRWPERRLRADAATYVLLREDGAGPNERNLDERGFVALSRRRPGLAEGQRLLAVKIRRHCAIDVPATLDRLAGLPVAGHLREFTGLDLLLAEQEFANAVVTNGWRFGAGRRSIVERVDGATLADALIRPER